MADPNIERLGRAYLAARDKGDSERAKMYATELRRLESLGSVQGTQPEEDQGVLSWVGDRLTQGVDQITEGVAETVAMIGGKGTERGKGSNGERVAQSLSGLIESDPSKSEGSRFLNEGGDGYNWDAAPGGILEQAPQFAGAMAATGTGAALGSVLGPVGTAVGGALGAGAFGIVQLWGSIANERAKNNGRDVPNEEDMAIALGSSAVSGVLDKFGPSATGIIKRAFTEGGMEAVQSVIEQMGGSTGTNEGTSVDLKQAVGEGILGGGSAGAVDIPIAAASQAAETAGVVAENIANSRIGDTSEIDADDAALAQRLMTAAGGDMDVLGEVRHTDEGSAKATAEAVLKEIRAEAQAIGSDLRTLAKSKDNRDAKAAVDKVLTTIGNRTATTPESFTSELGTHFGSETPDVKRLASLARQASRLDTFIKGGSGDLGGLGSMTRHLDLTDGRNSTKFMAAPIGLASGGLSVATGALINRVARGIDRLTNQRSRVKRYVDTVNASGVQPETISGETAAQTVDNARREVREADAEWEAIRKDEKRADKAQREYDKSLDSFEAEGLRSAANQNKALERLAKEQAKAKSQAIQESVKRTSDEAKVIADSLSKRTAEQAAASMMQSDIIPTSSYGTPYEMWNKATGMKGPKAMFQALQELEQEQKVELGTAKRWLNDIGSFKRLNKADRTTINIQEMVRQKIAPEYDNRAAFDESNEKKPVTAADALRKLRGAASVPLQGNRRKFKAKEGERVSLNLQATIEGSRETLKPDEYLGLMELRAKIDSPNMPRDARRQAVEEALPGIFRTNALRGKWKMDFAPLIAAGNDYAIERNVNPESELEASKEEAFERTVAKLPKKERKAAKKKAKKKTEEPTVLVQRALEKLSPEKTPEPTPVEPETAAEKLVESVEPTPEVAPKKGKASLAQMVDNRVEVLTTAIATARDKGPELEQYVASLDKSMNSRIEALLYEFASDRLTVNQIADSLAAREGIRPEAATAVVVASLQNMETNGHLKLVRPFKANKLLKKGQMVRDAEGNTLDVLQIEFSDGPLKDNVEIAKAVNMVRRMVDQKELPKRYTPTNLRDGSNSAFKSYDGDTVDGSFTPILEFLDDLRNARLNVDETMLSQIEEKLGSLTGSGGRVGVIAAQLHPSGDKSPIRTLAQLLFQIGKRGERNDNRIRQEWSAGDNLRVYSKNGSASSQGGDLMKAILKAPERSATGSEKAVDFLFHSFGNTLGYDKDSPYDRRQSLFNDKGALDALLDWSKEPFGRLSIKDRNGKDKPIARIIRAGEGFFQVLGVANELSRMVSFARARHKDLSGLSNEELLQNPAVREDLQKYETDYIVQLDANNNAYQIVGSFLGDEAIMRATGMLPPEDTSVPADQRRGADIYMKPALAIAERIPELSAANLPASNLRKLFKGPIGTFLYAAEFKSRQRAFEDKLDEFAEGGEVFGKEGLIKVPEEVYSNMMTEQGHSFTKVKYDALGEIAKTVPIKSRVVQEGDAFYVETSETLTKDKWTRSRRSFSSAEAATNFRFGMDFYGRLNRELVSEMNRSFPRVREYLDFADVVTKLAKASGKVSVKVPTIDGMLLDYNFKNDPGYKGVEVALADGKVVRLGVRSGDEKLRGRGLAAFMAHQADAYVLRTSHKIMKKEGGLRTFNPIHDSFGFHPADAERGQTTVLKVMQSLGSAEYDIFLQVLEANQINLQQFKAAGGVLPYRNAVEPAPISEIPTAVS